MRGREQTPQADLGNPRESGSGVPADDADTEVITAPADPADRQEFLQSLVAKVREEHHGDDRSDVEAALNAAIEASGMPQQPTKWVSDTSAEIAQGRHVVTDRHVAVASGPLADEIPAEAENPDA